MKRCLLVRAVLLLFLVGFMANVCISKPLPLTPVKVKEIIAKKVNEVLDAWISTGDTDLSEKELKMCAESGPMVTNRFLINRVFPESKHYIAAVTINIPEAPAHPFILSFKIKKGKCGWDIHEFREMDRPWQPVETFVFGLKEYLKVSLYKSKQKATMMDLKTISRAVENYMCDKHQAPQARSIKELERILEPFYIKTLPLHDAWGYELHYQMDKDNPRRYWIASGGSDGKLAGFDQTGVYTVSTFKEFANDFIFSDGKFVYSPKAKGSDSSSTEKDAKVSLLKGKQKATMMDLKTISRAVENYMCDKHHAPKANSIKELERILEPVYIKTLPLHDAWGHELHYQVDKDNPRRYWIASGGSDGKLTGFEQLGTYITFTLQDFTFDIICSNREFTFAPRVRGFY